ncbi:MAG: alanine racemase [Lachnospiraceae bacterium]|nr:alanine racemase [Lachnospiraceae bacterium]
MFDFDQYARTYVLVNLDHIVQNLENMKANIAKDTKMIAVIKADGYGHGGVEIASAIRDLPFLYGFATATYEEARELRSSGVVKPVLVLGYTFPYCYEEMVRSDIRTALFRLDTARELSDTAVRLNRKAKVHIKVDTGMSRIGIRPDECGLSFVKECMALPGLLIEGIFTHFAKADMTDFSPAIRQYEMFRDFTARIETELLLSIPVKHCSNSAGIIRMPEANLDVVRAGITLYGLWPSDEVEQDIVELHPALSWKSHIVFIKDLEAGREISYGGTFRVEHPMKVATIPVGYADGYPRSLSNKGYVLIRGKRAPILGRVCMDQMMVDVTAIPDATEGDEVVLIGSSGSLCITAEELGDLSGRFNYELVCDISPRVPRIYERDGRFFL